MTNLHASTAISATTLYNIITNCPALFAEFDSHNFQSESYDALRLYEAKFEKNTFILVHVVEGGDDTAEVFFSENEARAAFDAEKKEYENLLD